MIKVGAKITLHYDFEGLPPGRVRCAVVTAVHDYPDNTFAYQTADGFAGIRGFPEENLDWVRGHHAPDSPEVQAMRAAWAL